VRLALCEFMNAANIYVIQSCNGICVFSFPMSCQAASVDVIAGTVPIDTLTMELYKFRLYDADLEVSDTCVRSSLLS